MEDQGIKELESNPKKLLNAKEFGDAVGWAERTVRQKAWLRQIEFVRMGRSIRFKPETAEQLIRDGTVLPLPGKGEGLKS